MTSVGETRAEALAIKSSRSRGDHLGQQGLQQAEQSPRTHRHANGDGRTITPARQGVALCRTDAEASDRRDFQRFVRFKHIDAECLRFPAAEVDDFVELAAYA